MKNKILLFLKGLLMGICDLVPGISGGTIAFITGIYERLINAVKGFSLELIADFFSFVFNRDSNSLHNLSNDIKKLDLGFLIVLFLGIFSALLIGSKVIKFLLESYFSYTLSFFMGLILASSIIIFENIKNHNFKNLGFGFVGLVIGILLAFLIPVNVNIGLGYVFMGGFFAISAMFLPGISGAFILLIMGLYEFMINVLYDVLGNLNFFIIFLLGAILGAFVISRVISFLFKKDKSKTLYFLLGLVLGTLSVPVRKIFGIIDINNWFDISIIVGLFLLGILLVLFIKKYGEGYKKELRGFEESVFD